MKKTYSLVLVGAMAFVPVTRAVDRIVTTTAGTGPGSLTAAIAAAADGDTIKFNIPGAGVKYIPTPAGGYPFITNNNLTIDGYSQPGATPNTHSIHEPNNAQLKIVLDSRNGAGRPMGGPDGTTTLTDTNTWGAVTDSGWGVSEVAILPLYRGMNIQIKGLAFLSSYGSSEPTGGDMKAICIATDVTTAQDTTNFFGSASGWHISGCWIGVDPATGQIDYTGGPGIEPSSSTIGIATYGCKQANAFHTVYAANGTIGVAKNSTNPRAEFNVIVCGYGTDLQGPGHRYSGNFANVLPDGMHNADWNQIVAGVPPTAGSEQGDGDFECGGDGVANLTIGTDGDGVNDAEEGNVFGGSLDAGWYNVYMYSGPRTNIVFAGNYVGVAIDGTTRFTNTCQIVRFNSSTATGRVGSDFDGTSDTLEGNLIYSSWPFDTIYPTPVGSVPNQLLRFDPGAQVSMRGNRTIGNTLIPYTYADGAGGRLAAFTNYAAPFMDTTGEIIPSLTTTNVFPHLRGNFALGTSGYTTIVLDVYELDPEGWADGVQMDLAELSDNSTYTNGFPQGRKYVGSYTVANTGSFDITLPASSSLGSGGAVTITANYSADPAGTHNGRVHTSNFSNPGYVLPGGAASVGLTQIVPDVACWFDTVAGAVTNGFINLATQSTPATLGNWEPFASSIGDSTFLVEFNTFADDGSLTLQNNAVAKQPAAGEAGKVGYAYYGDNGLPYKGQINLSRQNGNPGRVAGDLRYGASKFITECEVSIGQLPEFQSVARWSNNNIFNGTARYCGEQLFNLNTTTLTQTPVTNAWEYVYGPYVGSMGAAADTTQVERTGGRPNFLDNGNIVVVINDKAAIVSPVGEVTTFAIIQPNGAIVKGPTLVDPRNIFDNACAYKGGFCVRVHNALYFYDNSGNLMHTNDVNRSSGIPFNGSIAGNDGDRGDALRIGGDIRSYYIFFAGHYGNNNSCAVAAWDTRTGEFVGSSVVSDGDPDAERTDRTSVAVDALNRVCVTYMYKPDVSFPWQAAARVAQFDGANFTWQTHSFYPFVNHDQNPANILGYTTLNPVVAMNTMQICIAAKGTINSTNSATAGPDSQPEQTVYTVISQPVPVPAPRPVITLAKSGSNLNLSWNAEDGLFTVQTASALSSPTTWSDATAGNVASPVTIPAGTSPTFVRLKR